VSSRKNLFYGKDQTGRKTKTTITKNTLLRYNAINAAAHCACVATTTTRRKQQQQQQKRLQQQQPRKEMAVKVARQMAKSRGVANEQSTESTA